MHSVKWMRLRLQLLVDNIYLSDASKNKTLQLGRNRKQLEVLCTDMNAPNYSKCKCILIVFEKNTFPVKE